MLVERLTTDAQPRSKNGHPPHRTTGVARSSSIQGSQPLCSACSTGTPGNIATIAMASSGAVRARLIQKRWVISRSSGFSSSVAEIVRGSSAMPQMGHDPGLGRTISGCIGQVYSTGCGCGLGVPRVTRLELGRAGLRYFPGSDLNFSAQPAQQKYSDLPACSRRCFAVAGFTFMPQTGSFTTTAELEMSSFMRTCRFDL